MKKIHKTLLNALTIFAFATPIWAAENGSCEQLKIQVSNATKSTCQLMSANVIHGNLIDAPPGSLFPGQSKQFAMSQTLYGPSITLTYLCDDNIVTISSQQNYCALKAGKVSGNIQSQSANLKVSFVKENGSYYWDTPGTISWVFSSK